MKRSALLSSLAALAGLGAAFAAAPGAAHAEPYEVAVFSALDKITAEISTVEAPLETPVKFGTLEVLVHSCNKRPPEEPPETTAFVEVFEKGIENGEGQEAVHGRSALTDMVSRISEYSESSQVAPVEIGKPEADKEDAEGMLAGKPEDAEALSGPGRIFSGWMFASSPGLNAVEHPVYDVWLIDCKTPSGEASSGSE